MTSEDAIDGAVRCAGAAVLAAVVLLAACGGGEQVELFEPNRIIAFGDEISVIDDPTATATAASTASTARRRRPTRRSTARCNPIWIQGVATPYGLVFPECNPAPPRWSRRRAGSAPSSARAPPTCGADRRPAGREPLHATATWSTVLIGQNDVLAQYAQYPAVSEAQLVANVEAAGQSARPAGQPRSPTRREGADLDHSRRRPDAVRARREGRAHRHRPRGAAEPPVGALQRRHARDDRQRRPPDRPGPARRVRPVRRDIAEQRRLHERRQRRLRPDQAR